ncbi:MAG: tetratricopeptide repeat protein [Desulfobulbaceae bacterium]
MFAFLTLGGTSLLSGCALYSGDSAQIEETDYGCSYFYFLWGRQAELSTRYDEALEAYRKALICDPDADHIFRKIPILLLRLNRGEEAVAMLEERLAAFPGDTDTRMLLARLYIGLGRYDEAADQYREIHRADPSEVSSLLLLSELYLNRGLLGNAREVLLELLRVSPESYPARVLLARIYLNTKQFEEAAAEYDRALEQNWSVDLLMEKGEVYRLQGAHDKVIELYREVLAGDPDNERAALGLINELLQAEREEEALEELSRLKGRAGLGKSVELSVARLFARLEKYDQSVEILRALLDREPSPDGRYLLGVVLTQQEKYDQAVKELAMISPDDEEFENAVILQVRILRYLDRYEEAIDLLERTVADEETRTPDMYVMLAALYHVQEKTEMGRKTFDRAMAAFPENNELLYEYGLFLDTAGRREEAMSVMQEVIRRQPAHGEALNYVGYTWADKSIHLDKALEYIERAVKLKPENGYIRDSLGWVYYRLGRFEEARQALEEAIRLSGDDPAIYDHLGDVYLELGRREDAVKTYRKGLEQFGESEDSDLKRAISEKLRLLEEGKQ